MRNALIVGINSTIGNEIFEILSNKSEYNIYTTSRTKFDKSQNHQIIDLIEEEELNLNLPDEIHELYYLPGTINLKPFKMLKIKDFKKDIDVNLIGFIKVLKECSSNLVKGNGAVLSFSSVAAKVGLDYHTSIALAKAGLEGLTKALAAEYATKVRFNNLAISLTKTNMSERLLNSDNKIEMAEKRNPLGKIGNPRKIAKFATFINAESGSWLSGESISFDGGMKSLKIFN